jgi:hypothetical protein
MTTRLTWWGLIRAYASAPPPPSLCSQPNGGYGGQGLVRRRSPPLLCRPEAETSRSLSLYHTICL